MDNKGWQVEFHRSATRSLRRLPKQIVQRVFPIIEALRVEPRPDVSSQLQGHESLLKIRVGNYRIIYELFDEEQLIQILRIGHRKDIYRDF